MDNWDNHDNFNPNNQNFTGTAPENDKESSPAEGFRSENTENAAGNTTGNNADSVSGSGSENRNTGYGDNFVMVGDSYGDRAGAESSTDGAYGGAPADGQNFDGAQHRDSSADSYRSDAPNTDGAYAYSGNSQESANHGYDAGNSGQNPYGYGAANNGSDAYGNNAGQNAYGYGAANNSADAYGNNAGQNNYGYGAANSGSDSYGYGADNAGQNAYGYEAPKSDSSYQYGNYIGHSENGAGGGASASKKKKRKMSEPLNLTKRAFVLIMIICMVVTSGVTIGGYALLSSMGVTTTKAITATNYTLTKASGDALSVEEIVAKNEDAVVSITTESVATDTWMQNYVTQGAGSGVVIDSNGYIVTCYHVIDGASKVTVTLKSGKEYKATIVGGDSENDIAVIKINATGLTAATYGDSSSLSVGSEVVAIGNPLGTLGGTATTGILSATDRELTVEGKTLNLLQTDASINPGNSGGGLFDAYGNLIGIVESKSTGSDVEGLGFALPVNKVAKVAKTIIEGGHIDGEAVIGVSVTELTKDEAQQYGFSKAGIYVAEVTTTNAQNAGLKVGDMIYKVGDKTISGSSDLTAALADHDPGDTITLTVIRDNQEKTIKVTLTSRTE